jgi:hypothetical protein
VLVLLETSCSSAESSSWLFSDQQKENSTILFCVYFCGLELWTNGDKVLRFGSFSPLFVVKGQVVTVLMLEKETSRQ